MDKKKILNLVLVILPLAAVVLAGMPDCVTVLRKDAAAVSYAADNGIRAGYALGGTGLISDQILRKVFAMAADAVITVK